MSNPASRLLTLLSLLQTRRDWPGGVLAARMEVTPRTVRRDIDRLREMGYRIRAVKGPDGGYRLDAGSELPPLLFDDDQAVAMAIALQTAAAQGTPVSESALRALATVRQVMPSRLRHTLSAMNVATVEPSGSAPAPVIDPEVLLTISAATRDRQVLRFDYRARDDTDTALPRRVEPHALVTSSGRWYVLAWDLEREGWRTFRADRISPTMPTGKRFTPREVPGGDSARDVAARFKGSLDGHSWPCQGQVRLARPAHEITPFAGDARVRKHDDNSCVVTAGSWSWTALAARFSHFDADIDEVTPPELVHGFEILARRYTHASSSSSGP